MAKRGLPHRLRHLPLTVKVPLVVMLFMASIAAFISERVLTRLSDAQTRHIEDLSVVHLDTLATALVDPLVRDDVWEAFSLLERAHASQTDLKPTLTVVLRADGTILASSDPRAVPAFATLPEQLAQAVAPGAWNLSLQGAEAAAYARRDIDSGGVLLGSLIARFDISPFLSERRTVLWTLVATNTGLTLSLSLLAWAVLRRMMRPVQILAARLKDGAEGLVSPIPEAVVANARGEFVELFKGYNAMAAAMRDREALAARLADEERLASLGRLASGMAHEINNPLGGLFNAIDTLRNHGDRADVRERSLGLVERGLQGIRDVVRTTLATYRAGGERRSLKAADIDDLRLLVEPEVRRKAISCEWANAVDGELRDLAGPVRQIALNLLLNACAATPSGGRIRFAAWIETDALVIDVQDGGPGLPTAAREVLLGKSPSVAADGHGVGLGLGLVRRLVSECGGSIGLLDVEAGAHVRVRVPMRSDAIERLRDVA